MKPKKILLLFIRSFFVGLSIFIPNISPALILIGFKMYNKTINSFASFKTFSLNISFMITLILGIIVSFFASSSISNLIDLYNPQINFLFIGIIIGGLSFKNKKKEKISVVNYVLLVATFILIIFLNHFKTELISIIPFDYFKMGFVSAMNFIIPSSNIISNDYSGLFNSLTKLSNLKDITYHLLLVVIYEISFIISLIVLSKLIIFIKNKLKDLSHFILLGLVLGSIVAIVLELDNFTFNFSIILTCIITFFWGFLLSRNIIKE